MKAICYWLSLVLLSGLPALSAQTLVDLRTQSKSIDFSSAASTKPFQTGTVLPATCSVGATFFNTAAAAGHNLYGCTAAGTWTLLGANLWFGGGTFNTGDCAQFNSAGNVVSAGGSCSSSSMVTMASPFTVAGSLMVSAGPGRLGVASLCTNSGGNLTCPGGFTGYHTWPAGSGTNTRQILAPAGPFTNSFSYMWADSIPSAATLMKIGTPSAGTSTLGPAIPDTDYVTPSGTGTLQNKTFDGTSLFSSYLPWAQISTPSAPASGYLRVYAKAPSGLCWMSSSGAETCAGGGVSDPGGSGLIVETSPGVTANRTITSGSSNISVTNGTGSGGNPTVDIASSVNFSGKTTSPVQVGLSASIPTTCTAGQLYFASDGVMGRQLQTCTATNTWTPVAYAQGAVNPVTCSVGQAYFNTGAAAGQNLYLCSTPNTWAQMASAITSIFGRTGPVTAQTGDYTYSQISNTPAALPPNGAASGDLSGSYPNPAVAQVNGAALPAAGVLKANGSRQIIAAVPGTDYAPATSGTSLLKGSGAGGFAAASAGTDYMGITTPVQAAQMPALTGDCVTSAGGVATNCTKTHGTTFAASATSDTTNAANISSGTLNAGRLPATAMQTNQSNTVSGGTQDFRAAAHTMPAVTGTSGSLPVSCTVGEVYFATNAAAGQNQFYCTATNVWTQQAAGSGTISSVFGRTGAVASQSGDYTYAQISNTPTALPPNGAASGDLSGSYPNPSVAQVNGAAVPTAGVLKANGSRQIVAAVVGTDYEVPLTFSGALSRSSNTITCVGASSSATGCLNSSDWTVFNNKQNALTNPVTGTGATSALAKFTATGTVGSATPGSDYAPATSGASLLKGNGAGGFAAAVSGSDYAPATGTTTVLKGSGSGGFSSAAAADVINLFAGCSGTQYLGADGGCHMPSGGSGGSGYVVLTTGSGVPSATCAAPSSSNLAVYLDTANGDEWWCYAANSWKKTLSVTGSGPYEAVGGTGTAPGTPSSGTVACYFDSGLNTQVCLDSSGNAWQMVRETLLADLQKRSCDIPVGDTSLSSVVTNAQLGPQKHLCKVPSTATVVEVDVESDAGSPSVIVGRRRCTAWTSGTCSTEAVFNLVSSALTSPNGYMGCSNTGGTAGLDGGTTCAATLENTSLNAGDWIELVSGTAGGTAKLMTVHIIYVVN